MNLLSSCFAVPCLPDLSERAGPLEAQKSSLFAPTGFEAAPKSDGVHYLQEDAVVEYFTDVEGNWMYFLQFVELSKILDWDEYEDQGAWGPGKLIIKPNGVLVFGGDSVDKGPGDIRVVKHLLHLKKRHWNQVLLVLGNRDINKLRFYAELAPGENGTSFDKNGPGGRGAYWVGGPSYKKYTEYLEEKRLKDNHISTLKWMLDCNMGCQQTTFKMRRRELAYLGLKATEEDVLLSYRSSVDPSSPDPWMLDFLRVGQLAVVLGDILFVHAGLCDDSIGRVPFEKTPRKNVHDWVRALNAWKDAQMEDYIKQPLWREEDGPFGRRRRGGDLLIDYGVPGGVEGVSVVYYNPFNNGNSKPLSNRVQDFLRDSNITRVLNGHQPHGDCPAVVRHVRTGLLTMSCDTSYSNMLAFKVDNESNNRGDACSVVRMERDTVSIKGSLSNGDKHEFILSSGLDLREFEFGRNDATLVVIKINTGHIEMLHDKEFVCEIEDDSGFKFDEATQTYTLYGKGKEGTKAYTGTMASGEDVKKVAELFQRLVQRSESILCDLKVQQTTSGRRMPSVSLKPEEQAALLHELVGRQLRDSSWVKTVKHDGKRGKKVVTALGKGFNLVASDMIPKHAQLSLRLEYHDWRFQASMRELTGDMERCNAVNQWAPPAEPDAVDLQRKTSIAIAPLDVKEFSRLETLIFDCQGTLYNLKDKYIKIAADRVTEVVADGVNSLIPAKRKVIFASNDSRFSRAKVFDKLRSRYKLNVGGRRHDEKLDEAEAKELAKRHVITSAYSCAWYLRNILKVKRPFVLCSNAGLLEELEEVGITEYYATIDKGEKTQELFRAPMSDENVMAIMKQIGYVDAIVCGWDMSFSALKVAVAAAYLKWSHQDSDNHANETKRPEGIRLVSCSSDSSGIIGVTTTDFDIRPHHGLTFSGSMNGRAIPALGNGTMVRSIAGAAGLPESHILYVGKPSQIFSEALVRAEDEWGYGVDVHKAVVIGDTLESDIELANRNGMYSILVRTGTTTEEDLEKEENMLRQPTWVVDSVLDLSSSLNTPGFLHSL